MPQATPLSLRRAAQTGAGSVAVAAMSLSLLSTPAAAAVSAPENLQATGVPVLSWDRPAGAAGSAGDRGGRQPRGGTVG